MRKHDVLYVYAHQTKVNCWLKDYVRPNDLTYQFTSNVKEAYATYEIDKSLELLARLTAVKKPH